LAVDDTQTVFRLKKGKIAAVLKVHVCLAAQISFKIAMIDYLVLVSVDSDQQKPLFVYARNTCGEGAVFREGSSHNDVVIAAPGIEREYFTTVRFYAGQETICIADNSAGP